MTITQWAIRVLAATAAVSVCAASWNRRQSPKPVRGESNVKLTSVREFIESYRVAVEIRCWRVTDTGLTAVKGVRCSMHSHNGGRSAEGVLWKQEAQGVSDDEGRATLVAATQGRKTIVALAEGMMPVMVEDTVVTQFSPERRINIVLEEKQDVLLGSLMPTSGGDIASITPRYRHMWPPEVIPNWSGFRGLERRVPDGWPISVLVQYENGDTNVVELDGDGNVRNESSAAQGLRRQLVRVVYAAPCVNEVPRAWVDLVAELAIPVMAWAIPERHRLVQFKSMFPYEYLNVRTGPIDWWIQTDANCRARATLPSVCGLGLVRILSPSGQVGSWIPFSLRPSSSSEVSVGMMPEGLDTGKEDDKDRHVVDLFGIAPVPKQGKGTVLFQSQRRGGAIVRRGSVGSDGCWALRGIPRTAKGWVQLLITEGDDVTSYLRWVACHDRTDGFGIVRVGHDTPCVEVDTKGLEASSVPVVAELVTVELRSSNGRCWCTRKVTLGGSVVIEGLPEGEYQLTVRNTRDGNCVTGQAVISGAFTRIVAAAASAAAPGDVSRGAGAGSGTA